MNRINRYFCVVLTALIKKVGENHRHYNNYKLFPVLGRIFVKNSHTYEKNNYFNDDRRDTWLLRL